MLCVSKLRRYPRHFHSFTGLSVAQFDQLLDEFQPVYEQQPRQQKNGIRQRQPGAGRPRRLASPNALLLGLVYLRLYLTQRLLAFFFDRDQSTVCRELKERVLPALLAVLPVPLRDAPFRGQSGSDTKTTLPHEPGAKPHRRVRTLPELLATYPELSEVLLDATEQDIPQPQDKQKRKQTYSGKQQSHTVKTQIMATKKQILHVFGGLPGSLADVTLLGASGVINHIPDAVPIRLDKGYQGTRKRYPTKNIKQPVKGKRGQKVTVLGKAFNYLLSTLRIYVEHHFARLQPFGILRQTYRGRFDAHEDVFCVVSGLLNFRDSGRFCLC